MKAQICRNPSYFLHLLSALLFMLKKHDIPAIKSSDWLRSFDVGFLDYLLNQAPDLHQQLLQYRQRKSENWTALSLSQFLIACAQQVECYVSEVFAIESEVQAYMQAQLAHHPVMLFKRTLVQKARKVSVEKLQELPSFEALHAWLMAQLKPNVTDLELAIARQAQLWHADQNHAALEKLQSWCVHAIQTKSAQALTAGWSSFSFPLKRDYGALVAIKPVSKSDLRVFRGDGFIRPRQGFALTDHGMSDRALQAEADYCIYCHKNQGDFCRRGFPVKKSAPALGLKTNALGEVLTGCPLDERISEMQQLAQQGYSVAALAMIMRDNPMCPATGHRICNDCMKACIYQKQSPVDIPQLETGVLNAVLNFSWGVEIYDLLLNWNPLRHEGFVQAEANGDRILVMGMGPAGFTMANQLLMAGYTVVGMDGLKIEPVSKSQYDQSIQSFAAITKQLDARQVLGFGGVAEYGITARWNKNYLSLILISLLRRQHFSLSGGVRFGGSITVESVWEMGFDHLVLAVGAGLPKALSIPGSLAPGVRAANDFLMALQLTGAHQMESLTSLSIDLPAVVIGGGLTGVDAATELQAYYLLQIKRVAARYAQLCERRGAAIVRAAFDASALERLDRWCAHADQLRRAQASSDFDVISLLHEWGGVTVVYRKRLEDSPAYQRNHEELIKALEEGILYAPCYAPTAVLTDEQGHCRGLSVVCTQFDATSNLWQLTEQTATFPARTVLVATGAQPNVAYGFEHADTFERKRYQYQPYHWQDGQLLPAPDAIHCKAPDIGMFTSYQSKKHCVSFIGDTHPVFHGSVVKAVASAMRAMPLIDQHLRQYRPYQSNRLPAQAFLAQCEDNFTAVIQEVQLLPGDKRLFIIRAPQVVKMFRPGHFVRLQTYESNVDSVNGIKLHGEAVALPVLSINVDQKTLTVVLTKQTVAEQLLAKLSVGQAVSLMGPTGVRAKIPKEMGVVLLVVTLDMLVNAIVLGTALRAAGHTVLMIVEVPKVEDLYLRQALEASADVIFWQVSVGSLVGVRTSDILTKTKIWPVFLAWLQLPANQTIAAQLTDVRLLVSSKKLVIYKQFLSELTTVTGVALVRCIAAVYGPMQCMLKGVCAQCLQWQIDPVSGERTKAVYACSWQDQPIELIDLQHLQDRTLPVRLLERLNQLYLTELSLID